MGGVHDEVWKLYRGDELIADLVLAGGEFPWLNARVNPHSGLEEVRELFAEELRRLDHIDDDMDGWEAVYGAIRSTVSLRYPDGREVPEFLLHIDADQAWWRWSDEPFDSQQPR